MLAVSADVGTLASPALRGGGLASVPEGSLGGVLFPASAVSGAPPSPEPKPELVPVPLQAAVSARPSAASDASGAGRERRTWITVLRLRGNGLRGRRASCARSYRSNIGPRAPGRGAG